MDLYIERFDCIKSSFTKKGEKYYFYKSYKETSWVRISKLGFENYLDENFDIAIEFEKSETGEIIFMKFKHEKTSEKRDRLKSRPPKEYKLGEFSLVKKTLGKNGNYYYYESFSAVDNINEVSWYRVDESYFNYILKKHIEVAKKIEYNENNEVIYMVYKSNRKLLPKTQDKGNGCLHLTVLLIIFVSSLLFLF